MIIASRNHADGAAYSGGAWSAALPAGNLADRQLARVARSLGVDPAGTRFLATFERPVPVSFVALWRHNMTQSGRWRVRLGRDALGMDADYDTGLCDAWPEAMPFGAGEWGEFQWGGKLDPEEAATYGVAAFHLPPSSVMARWLRVDLDDPENPAGYLQAARLFAGPVWRPSINMQYGWSIRQVDESRRTRSRGGQTYVDLVPRYRRLSFALDHLGIDEMFANAYELDRLKGVAGDLIVIPDPDERRHLHRQAILGALADTSPIEQRVFGLYAKTFTVEELL
jgi:hypothetical protein